MSFTAVQREKIQDPSALLLVMQPILHKEPHRSKEPNLRIRRPWTSIGSFYHSIVKMYLVFSVKFHATTSERFQPNANARLRATVQFVHQCLPESSATHHLHRFFCRPHNVHMALHRDYIIILQLYNMKDRSICTFEADIYITWRGC